MTRATTKDRFKTAGSEQWPVAMCQWLSAMLLSSCLLPAKDAAGGGRRCTRRQATGLPINEPEGPRVLGGTGPPRFCRQLGGGKPYHDGGGLCSPGRWPHHARSYADGSSWDWLFIRDRMLKLVIAKVGSEEQLEKEAFRMAAGLATGAAVSAQAAMEGVAGSPGSVGAGAARSTARPLLSQPWRAPRRRSRSLLSGHVRP